MKHAFRLSRVGAVAIAALAVLYSAIILAGAQANVAPTPAPFVVQLTSTFIPPTPPASPTPTPSPSPSPTATPTPVPRNSFASDIDGSGRFVVIESTGDIATERTPHVRNAQGQIVTRGRNNEDGNPEIFLLDYAQRRIFQITDTTHALKNTALSPVEPSNIEVEVVNLRPQLSKDGRYLVFISNAYVDGTNLSPRQFVGQENVAGLRQDANTEIFLYEMPVPPPVDLTSGAEVPFADMGSGTMRRITNTPASRPPSAGTDILPPFFARDNDAPAVSDDTQVADSVRGVVIAFHSRARGGNIGGGNPDGNTEIFIFEDTNLDSDGHSIVQATDTEDVPVAGQVLPRLVFNNNPSLSGDGTRLAFVSNGDEQLGAGVQPGVEAEAGRGNGEVYVANYASGATGLSNVRRVTTTTPVASGGAINTLSPGKRLSHNGNFLAFESFAVFNETGGVVETSLTSIGLYVYDIANARFTQVIDRPAATETQDIGIRWPTFTGDNTRVVWASTLNLRPDGTVAGRDDAAGLNPAITVGGVLRRPTQFFSAPVAGARQISRLTRLRGNFEATQPFPSNTVERMAFSSTGELGGGKVASNFEAFYLRIPRPDLSASPSPTPAAVSFFTGASDRPVVAATPAPSPSPGAPVTGLAPGMLGIARSELTIGAGPREVAAGDAHETLRRPPLPIELANVSISIDGAAAGLYSVAPNQINFVVPPGLTPSTTPLPVVIHNNGTIINTTLVLHPAQPDIFTSANGAGGRAAALNVTNPCVSPPGEPFPDRTARPVGSATTGNCNSTQTETVATELLFMVTGMRGVQPSQVTVRIGTTDLTGAAILSVGPSQTPGFDQIVVRLPASLNNAGDVPVVITVNLGTAGTFSSRPAATAPHITIN